jgi:DNA polymerase-1
MKSESGKKLIAADYSQIELRVIAQISGDQRIIDSHRKDQDLHRLTASLLSGKDMDKERGMIPQR